MHAVTDTVIPSLNAVAGKAAAPTGPATAAAAPPDIAELHEIIATLLETTAQLEAFMTPAYPDDAVHAYRRAHYAAQHVRGRARELLRSQQKATG